MAVSARAGGSRPTARASPRTASVSRSSTRRRTPMALSRDQILEAKDLETREVDCPEWGGSVLVRALSGRERDAWEASLVQMRGKQQVPQMGNVRAKLVVRCCVDENGERLFSDADVKA